MASIDSTANLAELLLLLEPLMEASGWPRSATPRDEEATRTALLGHTGKVAHDDVVAWCWFSDQWTTERELWPGVQVSNWELWFEEDEDAGEYFAYLLDELGFDVPSTDGRFTDSLTFGHYGDGLMAAMSPIAAGRTEPRVFSIEGEGAELFTTVVGEDRSSWMKNADELPTLRQWTTALVDAHISGRLQFVENPHRANGPPVVRGDGPNQSRGSAFHYPWPTPDFTSETLLVDGQSGEPRRLVGRRILRADADTCDLVWTTDGGRVLNVDGPRVGVIDVGTGKQLSEHSLGQLHGYRVKWSPDGCHYVVSGQDDSRSTQVVFLSDGDHPVHSLDGYGVDWSPLGTFIRASHRLGNGARFDVPSTDSWTTQFSYPYKYPHTWWSPIDRHLVARPTGDCVLWPTDSATPVMAFPGTWNHTRFIFAPDGGRLVETAGAGLRIVDTATYEAIAARTETTIADLAWSPESTRLALATRNGQVEIVDTAGELTVAFGEPQPIRNARNLGISWSPDGSRLVSNIHDINNQWAVRDSSTGEIVCELGPVDTPGVACVWSPDGASLLSGRFIFDATSGTITHHLEGLEGEASWSPDSSAIVARTRVDITAWDLS